MKYLSNIVPTARTASLVACDTKTEISALCGAFCVYLIRTKAIIAIILAVSLGGIANAQSGENAPEQVVDEDYWYNSVTSETGKNIGFYLRAILDEDGRVVICVVTINVKKPIEKRVMRAIKITLNDKVILRGIQWANNYNIAGEPIGRASSCRTTKAIAAPTDNLISWELAKRRF